MRRYSTFLILAGIFTEIFGKNNVKVIIEIILIYILKNNFIACFSTDILHHTGYNSSRLFERDFEQPFSQSHLIITPWAHPLNGLGRWIMHYISPCTVLYNMLISSIFQHSFLKLYGLILSSAPSYLMVVIAMLPW